VERNASLDGMRGFSALVVVLSHIVAGFLPAVYFGDQKAEWNLLETLLTTTPAFFVINGTFHVHVFFVLSGYVIAGSSAGNRIPLLTQFLARVLRLSLPCAAAIIITYVVFKMDAMHMAKAAGLVDHSWIKSQYPTADVFWIDAVIDALGNYYVEGGSRFVPVLWTMQRELIGSVGIYVIYKCAPTAGLRIALYVVVSVICVVACLEPQNYICFAAGAAMYDLHVSKAVSSERIAAIALTFGVFFGGKPPFGAPSDASVYVSLVRIAESLHATSLIYPVGALLLLFGVLASPRLQKLLGGRFGTFLGRISFSLYLVHFPLLGSVLAGGFVYFGHTSAIAFTFVTLVYLGVLIAASLTFYALVERPTLGLTRLVKHMRALSFDGVWSGCNGNHYQCERDNLQKGS
jgi:peptidoglycan/LPS O-acetylase OafA/YrhL